MRSNDRQLCALVRQMSVQTSQQNRQTSRVNKLLSNEDFMPSTDKVDCERGALDQDLQPHASRPGSTYLRLLRLVGFMSLALLVQRFWPVTFLHSCYHGWQSETVLGLDDLCPQVDALTHPEHEAMLSSLDEEFGGIEFKLKAYESLAGAIRIP